jgi:hypothetical protein
VLKKLGVFLLCLLVIWVVIDPVEAGQFTRHTLESAAAFLRSLGDE